MPLTYVAVPPLLKLKLGVPVTVTLSLKVTVKLALSPALMRPVVCVIPVTTGAVDTLRVTTFSEKFPASSVATTVMP